MTTALCLVTVLVAAIEAFNVDTRYPIIKNGPGRSHFGYTVELHRQRDQLVVLVGAPKANSTSIPDKFALESGALFFCPISSSGCEEVPLEKKVREYDTRKYFDYDPMLNDAWIGGSLDVSSNEDSNVVACGHLWKNRKYPDAYLTNGICYVIDSNLDYESVLRLQPLIGYQQQAINNKIYHYAFGLAGFSVQFLPHSSDLVMGAPGVYDWKGTIVLTDEIEYNRPKPSRAFFVPTPSSNLVEDSYFGYSVSSGYFFDTDTIQIVTGAPREGYSGMVYIFDKPVPPNDILIKIKKEGQQMGEYFGGSVCAVDLNNDQRSDLLIGAPLHALELDEGKVYVFMNDGKGSLVPFKEDLFGLMKPNARFGSAITAIDDINQDGYQDVAIGAPYEEEKGSVYIYHGSFEGIVPKFVQRIFAEDIHSHLQGFGISISKGKDIDDNKYPDIAIGAYGSDQIAVLRSRPLIAIIGSISFAISQVNPEVTNCTIHNQPSICFTVTPCLVYSGTHAPDQLEVNATLEMDTLKIAEGLSPRGFLVFGGDSFNNNFKYNSELQNNVQSCKNVTCHIPKSTTDFLTPIEFKLSYSVTERLELEKEFCSTCPMFDQNYPTSLTRDIPFRIDCGEDSKCQSDLSVSANFDGYGDGEQFIIGSNRELSMNVDVINLGEPAFLAQVFITFPIGIDLSRISHWCKETSILNQKMQPKQLICSVGNPLQQNEKISFQLGVDVSDLKGNMKELIFEIGSTTTSTEVNLDNNNHTLELPLVSDGDITIVGSTAADQIVYAEDNDKTLEHLNLFHKFEIYRYGSTPIESVTVEITVPVLSLTEEIGFIQIKSAKPQMNSEQSLAGVCYGEFVPNGVDLTHNEEREINITLDKDSVDYQEESTPGSPSEDMRKPKTVDHPDPSIVDCRTALCSTVKCTLGPFLVDEVASVDLELRVSFKDFLKIIRTREEVKLVVSAFVTINDEGYVQPVNYYPDQTQIITTFIQEGVPPPQPMADWIIPVCVIAGLLLLILIIFCLLKIGFFRRKEKEELEKMMMSADLEPENENMLSSKESVNEKNVPA